MRPMIAATIQPIMKMTIAATKFGTKAIKPAQIPWNAPVIVPPHVCNTIVYCVYASKDDAYTDSL